MVTFLTIVQLSILCVQLGCFFDVVKNKKDVFDVLYGFAIWGCVPNTLLMLLIKTL